jgi:hypothetical protein
VVREDNQYAVERLLAKRVRFRVRYRSGSKMMVVDAETYEKITDRVDVVGVTTEYKVRWKGWPPAFDEWVKLGDISPVLIREFHAAVASAS